jgi:DNA replication protein DnaC
MLAGTGHRPRATACQSTIAKGNARESTRQTTGTVDRLLHHAHIVIAEGTSYRLAKTTAGKGVIPLT